MMQKKYLIIMGVILLLSFPQNIFAHPHVFISQRVKIVFDQNGLAGFNMEWEFDDMFASMIAGDYDINRNWILEKNEISTIKKKAFSYLAHSDYFTFIKIDQKPFKVKFVKDFSAELKTKKLIYKFFIPCHVSAKKDIKHIIVATYDPTYYSAIFFAKKNGVTLDNPQGNLKKFEIKTLVKEDKSTKIYFDMINPMALFMDFKLK